MKLKSKRHPEVIRVPMNFFNAEVPDKSELEALMFVKTGKTPEQLQDIASACQRWANHYKWSDYDVKLNAMNDLFQKMLRM